MTNKLGSILHEGGVAEDMIGMAMRVDDVSDRLVGAGSDGREQLQSLANAATGVDDRNGVGADDEPDIGNSAIVLARHLCNL